MLFSDIVTLTDINFVDPHILITIGSFSGEDCGVNNFCFKYSYLFY